VGKDALPGVGWVSRDALWAEGGGGREKKAREKRYKSHHGEIHDGKTPFAQGGGGVTTGLRERDEEKKREKHQKGLNEGSVGTRGGRVRGVPTQVGLGNP